VNPCGRVFEQVNDLIEVHSREDPTRLAMTYRGNAISYGDLAHLISRAASGLRRAGVKQGDSVSVLASNCPDIYVLFFATAKIGAVFVPINKELTETEIAYLVSDAKPVLIVTEEGLRDRVQRALQLAQSESTKIKLLSTEIESVSRLGTLLDDPMTAPPLVDRESPVLVSYTSGTTSAPKAVAVSHRIETDSCKLYSDAWGLQSSDKVLMSLSLGWIYGLNPGSTPAFRVGGSVQLMEKFHPVHVLEMMERERTTVFVGVPTMYAMMIEHVNQTGRRYDLSSLRLPLCAGAELPVALREKFSEIFGVTLWNFFGISEVKLVASPRCEDGGKVPDGSVGKIPPGVCVRLVDTGGRDVPLGETGEVLVKTPVHMLGYYNDPEKTRSVFRDDWYVSGDLGRFDDQGNFFVVGRTRDQIIRGGAKVAPSEIEDALSAHPDVILCAVIGVPDEIFGESIKAFVVTRGGAQVTADDLKAHCGSRLASYKVPSTIEFRRQLPLGATGKVLKKALREE
jgi:long-chain acyl-CoA synthetase